MTESRVVRMTKVSPVSKNAHNYLIIKNTFGIHYRTRYNYMYEWQMLHQNPDQPTHNPWFIPVVACKNTNHLFFCQHLWQKLVFTIHANHVNIWGNVCLCCVYRSRSQVHTIKRWMKKAGWIAINMLNYGFFLPVCWRKRGGTDSLNYNLYSCMSW